MNKYILGSLENLPYFTIEAIRQLAGDEPHINGTLQTALYRWCHKGDVIALKKGVYTTRRFVEIHRSEEDFLPAISAILIPQSYTSMEYELQRRGILTEVVYPLTAVTPKQTRLIQNPMGDFAYRNIKQDLYAGFEISDFRGVPFARATLAKALFDFLYLRPLDSYFSTLKTNLAENLRLNLEEFTNNDQQDFVAFVEFSKSRKMDRILKNLRRTIWRP